MVSKKFIAAVKLSSAPAYRLAQQAGIDSVTLSKLMRGIVRHKPDDHRIITVGALLGLKPSECFESIEPQQSVVKESGRDE
jgi:hypothetical protein